MVILIPPKTSVVAESPKFVEDKALSKAALGFIQVILAHFGSLNGASRIPAAIAG